MTPTPPQAAPSEADERQRFEAWISGPPYERDPLRYPDDATKYAWPGNYRSLDIDLAWCSWQARAQAAAPAGAQPTCPRVELVVAVHKLASHFENALYAFRDDAEALAKAKGDIAHAMKIAAKHNQNGPGCAPPPVAAPTADDEAVELAAALEIRAILEQIKEVAAVYPVDDMPTPFQSAWRGCCEEIFYRATGRQWHMDDDDGRRGVEGDTAGHRIVQSALAAPALSNPVAWQERQQLSVGGPWTGWYECDQRPLDAPRASHVGGIPIEWRPLCTVPTAAVQTQRQEDAK